MRKIMLLIFIALTLVSCGVNTLKPDELELSKLPEYGKNGLNPSSPPSPRIDIYKPTYTGSITDADQTDKYIIAGYREGLFPVGPDFVLTSHLVYTSYAKKGSEIFGASRTGVIDPDADGNITIPLGTDLGPPQIGGKYRIWVIKVSKPQLK